MILLRSVGSFRLAVAVVLLLMAALLARFPAHNGDLPFYIAAAFSAQGLDDSTALAAAAREIGATLPAKEAAHHLRNLEMAPARFLDFYRIKAGYTGTLIFLHRLGVSYVTATVIPSLFAFFLLGWIVFLWCGRIFGQLPALITPIFLLAGTSALQLGRISTPDPVSQCLLLLALYRIHFDKNLWPTLVSLFLALLFRPDNLPAVLGMLVLMSYLDSVRVSPASGRFSQTAFFIACAGAVICCVLINVVTEPVFWWFRPVPYPGIVDVPDPLQGLHFLMGIALGPLPVLIALTAVVSRLPQISRAARAQLIFLGLMFPVRYLAFPHYEDRFFVAFYLAGYCLLLGEFAGQYRTPPLGIAACGPQASIAGRGPQAAGRD